MFIYEQRNWPHFTWDESKISPLLAEVRHIQGRLLGRMSTLGFSLKEEATLKTLTQDVLKTSAIEDEILSVESVRSSVARRLGIDLGGETVSDQHVEGIVEITLDATRHYNKPLTTERLFGWHAALFPEGYSGMHKIKVGQWRDDAKGPMQVVSGPVGQETIHYQAPPAAVLELEMNRFLTWFNSPAKGDLVMKAALAHYWFVVLHPFDDGNGRLARALSDMTLAQSEGTPHRFYSMSSQIQQERKNYYAILEESSKGSMDITLWQGWFLNCLMRGIQASDTLLDSVLIKATFWESHTGERFNERQVSMINRLFDDFKGHLTTSKWAKITKCSPDTALRDINDLIARNILKKESAGGRSTRYTLSAP